MAARAVTRAIRVNRINQATSNPQLWAKKKPETQPMIEEPR